MMEVGAVHLRSFMQNLFIELEPKLMVLMNYGSMVYLLKAHFQNNINLTDDLIQTAIYSC